MELLGSKGGTINRAGDARLTQRNGVATNLQQEMSKSELIRAMEQMSRTATPEEKIALQKKAEERKKIIEDNYKKWLNHDHASEYKNHTPTNPNHSIIKIFYYNEMPKSDVLILDGLEEGYHRVFPVAKVVAVSQYDTDIRTFKVNDVVSIPAVMCKTIQSADWMRYQKEIREQPSLKNDFPEPPAYIGKLNEWNPYIYQKDPFTDANLDDQHTFCLRDSLLQTKITK